MEIIKQENSNVRFQKRQRKDTINYIWVIIWADREEDQRFSCLKFERINVYLNTRKEKKPFLSVHHFIE